MELWDLIDDCDGLVRGVKKGVKKLIQQVNKNKTSAYKVNKAIKQSSKSINNYKKRISEHEKNIQDLIVGKYKIDPSKVKGDLYFYRQGLIKHRQKEIITFQNNIKKEMDLLNSLR